ncbi:hypothetical protein M434DRAFT_75752, partial [Hypoxylon sp. CO27-5]
MDELYHYSPLPVSGWFRVLIIEPSGDPENSMNCKLRHHPISPNIGYDALSYTWGDEEPECQIFIDKKLFWIRKNLYTALQVVRQKDKELFLWVDAICINQDDENERDYQVRQMNDIFAKASLVRVWLGAATIGSDPYYKPIMPLLEDSQSLADLDQAVLLLCRPWWKRMWTLQESVLCKQVV